MTKEDAIKFLQQLYPYGGHCWLDKQRTEAIGMAIEALRDIERNGKDCKDDPVSDDFEEACNQMSKAAIISKCEAGNPFFSDGDFKLGFKAGASWQKQKDDEMLTVVYMDGVEKGKKTMQDQMMKETIDFLKSYRRETPDKTGYIVGIIDDTTIEDYRKLWEG